MTNLSCRVLSNGSKVVAALIGDAFKRAAATKMKVSRHGVRLSHRPMLAEVGAMRVNPKVLPITKIVLNVFASGAYAFNKDWRHTIYWAAAAIITASVTF